MITFALNYLFGGLDPLGYHLVNIAIHALATILLYFLVVETVKLVLERRSLDESPRLPHIVAFWSAVIWAVNPLQVLSVTLVCQRMNAMAGAFSLLSLLLYVKGRLRFDKRDDGGRAVVWTLWALSALSAVMALASKQNAIMTPFFILLYEWFFFRGLDRAWIKRWLWWTPLALIVIFALGVFWVGEGPFTRLAARYATRGFTVWERLLTEARAVFHYLFIYLFPLPSQTRLIYDYPISNSPISPPTTLLALAGLVACAVLMFKWAKTRSLLVFAMAWWFGQLIIESTIIPLEPVFEYRVYTPSMFLLVPVILVLLRDGRGGSALLAKLRPFVLACVALVYAFFTAQRNELMAYPLFFWADAYAKAPNEPRTAINYANELSAAGRRPLADRILRKVLEKNPKSPEALHNLGANLASERRYGEAEKLVRKSISVEKNYIQAYVTLAAILMDTGRMTEAGVHLEKAWRLSPNNPMVAAQMGDFALRLGDVDEAERLYKKALDGSSGIPRAAHNLGMLYFRKGNMEKAAAAFGEAIKRDSTNPVERYMAGVVAMRRKDFRKAARFFQDALDLNPHFSDARKALGVARRAMNMDVSGIGALEKVLERSPDDDLLLSRLGTLLLRAGRIDEAEIRFKHALKVNPRSVESTKGMGDIMMMKKRYPEAEKYFVKALVEAPDDPVLHHNLASALACQGRLKEAVVQYREALRLKPDYAEAALNLRKAEAELRDDGRTP